MRKRGCFLIGAAGAVLVGVLAFCLSFPSVDPSIWRVYAEVTADWPGAGVTPVLWRKLVSLGCAPNVVSSVSVGLLAWGVFDVLWRTMFILACPQNGHPNWRRVTVPSLSVLGAALAVFSEPVWRQALSGSPGVLTVALFLLAIDLFLVSFYTEVVVNDEGDPVNSVRVNSGVGVAFLIAGALSVETPAAFLLPVLFCFGRMVMSQWVLDGRYQDQSKEIQVFAPVEFPNWMAFFLWLAGLVFVGFLIDGPKETNCLLACFVEWVRSVRTAASLLGWVLWMGCRIVPIVLIGGLVPLLTAKTAQRTFVFGVVLFLVGVVSLALASPGARGDWVLVPAAEVQSPFMQSLGAVLTAFAVALTLMTFAWLAFHEMPYGRGVMRRIAVWSISLAVVAATAVAASGICRDQARQLRQVIVEAVEETAREAEGLSWIFTDGSADVGVERVARQRGQTLRTQPLIKGGPFASTNDSAVLLRDWLAQDSTNLQASAVQLGFDLWRREHRQLPVASGLLARFDWPEGACARGISAAERLGERMMELSGAGALAHESEPCVRTLFASFLWRLSRMARQRGDMDRADRLDAANDAQRRTMELVHRERTAALRQLTDTEGLQLALNRADFIGARGFARRILERTPDDVAANFALGMGYLLEKKPKEAVLYLETAHRGKSEEPAILNNLAIAYLQMGDLENARIWARKAFDRAPEIPEIRETLRRIEVRLASPQKATQAQ